ncbi:MAG: carboxypeptidase Taq [Solirubrobacteraceae bacterium]|jgi:carboxypeptidase Taq|nr:carboxypeptidase Taq [Solirubrobacteraceae bacterium]
MSATLDELREQLAEVRDLETITMTLLWDQQTMMPPGGGETRADQLATLERLRHDRGTCPELGALLDKAEPEVADLPADSDDASLVRVARRDFEKAVRVPSDLKGELARAASLGQEAWTRARARSDFPAFLPHLERILELKHRYVACFEDGIQVPYDALLDDYEPDARTQEVAAVFAELKAGLVPLIAQIGERQDAVDSAPLRGSFDPDAQRALARRVLGALGFDDKSWRLDEAAHPFSARCGVDDNRITTRVDRDYVAMSLYASLHECGHSLYEAGVAPELARTPLGSGVSLGVHESQSRLWENLVGRSRPFCGWLLPQLREAFPGQFDDVDADALFRALNEVKPSFIRVEADEATYSLHVILRFELEQELIDGGLAPRDLPEAWNARVHDYLGLEVTDDAYGVLQDVHWSAGLVGYFPTYALGNVIGAQIWERVHTDLPDVDERIGRGELDGIREWLVEHLYRHGRKFTPRETVERVTGAPLDVQPYLGYLRGKFGEIYGL